MNLTADECAAAPLAPAGKTRKLNDGNGLYLLCTDRAKGWRYRYKLNGKDQLTSLGVYPAVSLHQARDKASTVRAGLENGESPVIVKARQRVQEAQQSKPFGVVAAEYNVTQEGMSRQTRERCGRMLRHSSKLHARTLDKISRPDVLAVCRVQEHIGQNETAHRLGIYFSNVFRFARDEGYFSGHDPTQGGFGKSLEARKEKHLPSVVDGLYGPERLKAVRSLLLVIDTMADYEPGAPKGTGSKGPTVGHALQLMARTAARPGILANAEWREVDLEGKRHAGQPTWVIPKSKMKMKDVHHTDHVIPLSTQAVEILMAQHELTGHGRYVFPNAKTEARPMTESAMGVALIRLEFREKHVPHGFRTVFATLARDELKAESELVERQLAHKVGNSVAQAYDRSQRLDERRALMQEYSDLLDQIRDGD